MIQAPPFVGKLRIDLEYPSFKKGLCFHLDQKRTSYISSIKDIPENTYLAIFHGQDSYRVCLCLSHQDMLSSLGNDSSLMLSSGKSNLANKMRSALVIEEGKSLYDTIKKAVHTALFETGQYGKPLDEKSPLPSFFNFLGWRSGGKQLSHSEITDTINSLKKRGLPIKYVLLDEGWQGLKGMSLNCFNADPARFPSGLAAIAEDLKSIGVERIGVWHAMMGYRGGVSSNLAKYYGFPPDSYGRYFPGYDFGKTFQFFYDYYTTLRKQGISFVYVGDQESTSFYCRKGMDSTCLYKNLQMATQAAASLNFQAAPFNADCLRGENLFYWTSSRVAHSNPTSTKNEGERIQSALSHSLWLQHLMQPDFGVWDSQSEASVLFQALSGSFTITEMPEANNLHKMILPSGKILIPDHPLTLCEDSLFSNPIKDATIYKAFARKGDSGILAAFHLNQQRKEISGTISPNEIPGLIGDRFALFSYQQGFLRVVSKNDFHKIQTTESDVFTFSPIFKGIAVIGCPQFILTFGPITNVSLEAETLHLFSMVSAPMLIYSERKILEVRKEDRVVPWAYNPRTHILSIEERTQVSEVFSRYTIFFE